jgi:hypothetical protein
MALWLRLCTFPELGYIVWSFSRYNAAPTEELLTALRYMYGYISKHKHVGITFSSIAPVGSDDILDSTQDFDSRVPTGWADADWASVHSAADDSRSVGCQLVMWLFGPLDFTVHLQRVTSRSATESELRSLTENGCDMVYWRKIFSFLRIPIPPTLPIYSDSSGAIQNGRHAVASRRLRHVSIDVFTIRQFVADKLVLLRKVHTDFNPSDLGTKLLGRSKFIRFTSFLKFYRSSSPKTA